MPADAHDAHAHAGADDAHSLRVLMTEFGQDSAALKPSRLFREGSLYGSNVSAKNPGDG